MKKSYKLSKTFWVMTVLAVIIALLIFGFSSQDASESDGLSSGLAYILFEKLFGAEFAEGANHVLRKSAHFLIYMVLGFCTKLAYFKSSFDVKPVSAITFSAVICFFYAASDEIHQFFVPGRSCSVSDVFLDTFGALCGALFAYIVIRFRRKVKKTV